MSATEMYAAPSQAWLDKNGVELTGEFRVPKNDDELIYSPKKDFQDKIYSLRTFLLDFDICGGRRWILRKKDPLKCPPRPTDDQVERLCKSFSVNMRLTGKCEDPKGRPFVTYTGRSIYTLDTPGENHPEYGYRRWILEEVPEAKPEKLPWRLNKIHDGKLVESKDGTKWGTIAGSDGQRFILMDGRTIYPDDLMRDWTWNGRPCSF